MRRLFRLTFAAMPLLALAFAGSAQANIYIVSSAADDGGSGTLRAKLTSANATAGTSHTFYFDLPPGTTIKLESPLPKVNGKPILVDGMDRFPVIDGQEEHAIFIAGNGGSITLRNLTLKNGRSDGSGAGGCLASFVPSNASLTVENVTFENCRAERTGSGDACGGAIFGRYPITIRNSRFIDNRARSAELGPAGGAVCAIDTLTIEDSHFIDNGADSYQTEPQTDSERSRGGAVFGAAKVTITGSQFISNFALAEKESSGFGGAVHIASGYDAFINGNLFFDNYALRGSALYLTDDGKHVPDLLADNNIFAGNHGNGALFTRGPYRLHNNTFWKNRSLDANQGAHLIVAGPAASVQYFSLNLLAPTLDGRPACSAENIPENLYPDSFFNAFPDTSCTYLHHDMFDMNAYPAAAEYRIRSLRRLDNDPWSMPVVELFADSIGLDVAPWMPPNAQGEYPCANTDILGSSRVPDGDGSAPEVSDCDRGAYEIQREASIFADDFEQPLLR